MSLQNLRLRIGVMSAIFAFEIGRPVPISTSARLVSTAERPRFRGTKGYGTSHVMVRDQSGFAPENVTTLPHFSVSFAINVPRSWGVMGIGRPPISASRALILASAMAALISLFNLSMISAGVLLGTPMPNQPVAS